MLMLYDGHCGLWVCDIVQDLDGYHIVRSHISEGHKPCYYSGPSSYDRLDTRTTWVTTKILVLTYDQSLELRPACWSRPKRAVVNKDPRCVHKLQSEPRYACLWT